MKFLAFGGFDLRLVDGIIKTEQAEPANLRKYEQICLMDLKSL